MTLSIIKSVYCFFFYSIGCMNGWTQFENRCYLFSRQVESWIEASTVCGGFHSKLAEPMNTNTSHFLISHSQIIGGTFWIGISDIIQEGKWIYSTRQIPIKVNNFQPGEPNAGTAANCVALWAGFYGYWADENCLVRYQFICEADNK
ncbi:tetranectin-like protein [Mytilus californianus]|uniref:tetranectin-like protein n=1 Tax=Mytilus californianus TaxID=6549 RepID=UPI0022457918|nr:tetranectin-like protein [Mytilus californianus]